MSCWARFTAHIICYERIKRLSSKMYNIVERMWGVYYVMWPAVLTYEKKCYGIEIIMYSTWEAHDYLNGTDKLT